MNDKPNDKRLSRDIVECYSSTGFFKVKADSFGIDRLQIDFVSLGENDKAKSSVTIFVSIYKALSFAGDILSGRLQKLIEMSREKAEAAGEKFAGAVWEDYGGLSSATVKKRNIQPYAKAGKPVSRILRLAPGTGQPYVFTATQSAGVERGRGAITPEKGAATERIMVGFDADKLKEIAYAITTEWGAYINSQYARNAYKAEWNGSAGSQKPTESKALPQYDDEPL